MRVSDGQRERTVSLLGERYRHDEHGWLLSDLGSRNGTRVNGWRVSSARLRRGDRIDLGAARFVFEPPAAQ